jgi:RNA polymerase sigma-32 factor
VIDLDSKPKRKEFVKVPKKKKPPVSKREDKGTAKAAIEPDNDALDAELVLDQEPAGALVTADGAILPEVVFDEDGRFPHEFASELEDPAKDLEVAESRYALTQSSPLSRYLAEIRKYSLLTIEEERALATKAYEDNDLAARNKLVTSNLRLVVKIAMEYRRSYVQILDLIQEGNAGLVQAVNRFNPYRNVKLSTYSAWWIRAYILKFLMDNKSLVRMGTTDAQRKLFFRLRGEAERIYALTQRYDTLAIAGSIGVKESDVIEMQERLKSDVSLDAPVDESGESRVLDRFASAIAAPDEQLAAEQLRAIVRKSAAEVEKTLNERDAFIFSHRLMAEEPITLQELGDKFGITRERARQLESRVIEKIRDKLVESGVTKPR